MKKNKISITIITFNEQDNIATCLDSVKNFSDEIVIVDSGSTDKTLQIAHKYDAKIFHRDFDSFSAQKNYADSKASGEWIFSIDADEIASKALSEQIPKAIKNNEIYGYLIPRNNIMLGSRIRYTRWAPDKHIWLYKKSFSKWTLGVHAEVEVEGKIGELSGPKIHKHNKSIEEFFSMLNRYTKAEALEHINQNRHFSFFSFFYEPTKSFVGRFILKFGFLDGWRGFMLSYLRAIYKLAKWVKIWESTRNLSHE